ncbi:transcriptional regulator [Methanococcoides seepicolus]|uniref:Transcriptional regulator n=1 Tax=Methanococcoides seepicolus TaxID=2828780 RepID=A0A9E4ZEI9_9EURY|nr:transcriptional regulator [Methanococcoides seepicolus]MCM1986445.1 transcriptional regulator [Methanococcoides seepicolus]
MEELMGFVTGNKNRQKLLALLESRGQLEGARIAKNMHIAKISADKILEELAAKELIVEESGFYKLTELGTTVTRTVLSI